MKKRRKRRRRRRKRTKMTMTRMLKKLLLLGFFLILRSCEHASFRACVSRNRSALTKTSRTRRSEQASGGTTRRGSEAGDLHHLHHLQD